MTLWKDPWRATESVFSPSNPDADVCITRRLGSLPNDERGALHSATARCEQGIGGDCPQYTTICVWMTVDVDDPHEDQALKHRQTADARGISGWLSCLIHRLVRTLGQLQARAASGRRLCGLACSYITRGDASKKKSSLLFREVSW